MTTLHFHDMAAKRSFFKNASLSNLVSETPCSATFSSFDVENMADCLAATVYQVSK